jgi:hypothetical protein
MVVEHQEASVAAASVAVLAVAVAAQVKGT